MNLKNLPLFSIPLMKFPSLGLQVSTPWLHAPVPPLLANPPSNEQAAVQEAVLIAGGLGSSRRFWRFPPFSAWDCCCTAVTLQSTGPKLQQLTLQLSFLSLEVGARDCPMAQYVCRGCRQVKDWECCTSTMAVHAAVGVHCNNIPLEPRKPVASRNGALQPSLSSCARSAEMELLL